MLLLRGGGTSVDSFVWRRADPRGQRSYGLSLPSFPGTRVGALSAVIDGANEPTFCFSVGVSEAGDWGALLGALVSFGAFVVSLPQAVMVAIPTMAAVPARSATLDVRREVVNSASPWIVRRIVN